MSISHTLSTSTRYVSVSIVVLAMTLFLAGCPSPNDPAVDPSVVSISTSGENNINEGGSISVTITSEKQVPNGLEVSLIIGGDATIDEDYALPGVTTNTLDGTVTATVTISSGNTETMLTIDATNDSIREVDENLTITISDEPSTYRIKEDEESVTVTITDDDLPTVGFRTTSQTQTLDEGDVESVTVTVERSNDEVRDPLTVQLSFAGSATEGDDYEVIPRSVTIGSGEADTHFTLQLRDDGDVEGDEEVIITISEVPSAYTIDKDNNEVTITVVDDEDTDGDMIPNSEDVDDDNNGLIEIHNLDMLRNVHFNLAGTSYDDAGIGDPGDTNGAPASPTDHCKTRVNGVYLCGYELTRNLDFTDAGSYATGTINNDWRLSDADNSNNATNEGFPGIGPKKGSGGFTGIFEGNDYSISNLYMRNTTTTDDYRTGLFRFTEAGAKIRNLGMINVAIYGGAGDRDRVGGLVGYNDEGTITASYVSGTVDGGAGNLDYVGGLVGVNEEGDITASYASGTVDGGDGDTDDVGGLVGFNYGAITASYASGTVDGGAGNDYVGGLVGYNTGPITASYASGTVDGGAGDIDNVGGLVGVNFGGAITDSYGFGEATNVGFGSDGTTKPILSGRASITTASQLSQPGSAASATTAPAGPSWNNAVSNTLGAWDFGTSDQNPALKYADYDGLSGTTYSCGPVPTCGSFLPEQGR